MITFMPQLSDLYVQRLLFHSHHRGAGYQTATYARPLRNISASTQTTGRLRWIIAEALVR